MVKISQAQKVTLSSRCYVRSQRPSIRAQDISNALITWTFQGFQLCHQPGSETSIYFLYYFTAHLGLWPQTPLKQKDTQLKRYTLESHSVINNCTPPSSSHMKLLSSQGHSGSQASNLVRSQKQEWYKQTKFQQGI